MAVSPHKAGYATKIGPSELHSCPCAEKRLYSLGRRLDEVAHNQSARGGCSPAWIVAVSRAVAAGSAR